MPLRKSFSGNQSANKDFCQKELENTGLNFISQEIQPGGHRGYHSWKSQINVNVYGSELFLGLVLCINFVLSKLNYLTISTFTHSAYRH